MKYYKVRVTGAFLPRLIGIWPCPYQDHEKDASLHSYTLQNDGNLFSKIFIVCAEQSTVQYTKSIYKYTMQIFKIRCL